MFNVIIAIDKVIAIFTKKREREKTIAYLRYSFIVPYIIIISENGSLIGFSFDICVQQSQ